MGLVIFLPGIRIEPHRIFPDWWFHSASPDLYIISTMCLSILHPETVQKEPQVITGETGSETGSCAVDLMWLCICDPRPASQLEVPLLLLLSLHELDAN